MRTLLTLAVIVGAVIWAKMPDPEERYGAGYSDGFASAYNSACNIRRNTLVEGDYGNNDYAAGWMRGNVEGLGACNRDRRAGLFATRH